MQAKVRNSKELFTLLLSGNRSCMCEKKKHQTHPYNEGMEHFHPFSYVYYTAFFHLNTFSQHTLFRCYDLWSPHSTPWTTDVIQLILTLKMTTAQVVETSVTVNNNRSIQDYVLPDDQTQPTFINLVKTILTSSRNLKMSYVTRPCWLYKANCKSFIPNWKNVVSSNKPRTMRLQGFMSIRSLAKQMQSSFNKS